MESCKLIAAFLASASESNLFNNASVKRGYIDRLRAAHPSFRHSSGEKRIIKTFGFNK